MTNEKWHNAREEPVNKSLIIHLSLIIGHLTFVIGQDSLSVLRALR